MSIAKLKFFFRFLMVLFISIDAHSFSFPKNECDSGDRRPESIHLSSIGEWTIKHPLEQQSKVQADTNSSKQKNEELDDNQNSGITFSDLVYQRKLLIDWTAKKFSPLFEFLYHNIELPLRSKGSAFRDRSFQTFARKIHPFLKENYRAYYQKVGQQLGANVYALYLDALELYSGFAGLQEIQSVQKNLPLFELLNLYEQLYFDFQRVKIRHSSFLGTKPDSEEYKFIRSILSAIDQTSSKTPTHLKELLKVLLPSIEDKQLASCLRVHIVDLDEVNAYSTGCHIFISSAMYKKLASEELIAVLSHELGHSIRAHRMKNFSAYFWGNLEQFFYLVFDEIAWLLTEEVNPQLKIVMDEGYFAALGNLNSLYLKNQELEADAYGAVLLNKTGVPVSFALSALKRVHGMDQSQDFIRPTKITNHLSTFERSELLNKYICD